MEECLELETDINKLKNDMAVFEDSIEGDLKKAKSGMAEIEKTIDGILDKHKEQFMENNPELFAGYTFEEFDPNMPGVTVLPNGDALVRMKILGSDLTLLVKIDKTEDGFVANEKYFSQGDVSSVLCLSGQEDCVVANDTMQVLRSISIDENGDFSIGENAVVFDELPLMETVLPSGEIFVFEADGRISFVKKDDNGELVVERGKFNFGGKIMNVSRISDKDWVLIGEGGRPVKVCHLGEDSDNTVIEEISLPDENTRFTQTHAFGRNGEAILMASASTSRKPTRLRKDSDGRFYLGEEVDDSILIISGFSLPNGDIMSIDLNGAVKLTRETDNGEIVVESAEAHSRVDALIYGYYLLSNGEIALECEDGLRFLRKNKNGDYTVSEAVYVGDDDWGQVQLDNGRIMGFDGRYHVKMLSEKKSTSLSEVKERLSKIAAKARKN